MFSLFTFLEGMFKFFFGRTSPCNNCAVLCFVVGINSRSTKAYDDQLSITSVPESSVSLLQRD